MDTTDSSNQQKPQSSVQSQPTNLSHHQAWKESEPVKLNADIQHVPVEVEIPIAVEKAGVESTEKYEIPPDLKKLGVTTTPSATLRVNPSVTSSASVTLPAVSLPLSDTKILFGLHSSVYSAFSWLAVWCLRKLRKAHIALKIIHGRVIRVGAD